MYDSTLPLQPIEIQHLNLEGLGNPLQIVLDPRGTFLYVVTQRGAASVPIGKGNTLRALKIDKVTGKLVQAGTSIVQLPVPPGTRPQGVAAVELAN